MKTLLRIGQVALVACLAWLLAPIVMGILRGSVSMDQALHSILNAKIVIVFVVLIVFSFVLSLLDNTGARSVAMIILIGAVATISLGIIKPSTIAQAASAYTTLAKASLYAEQCGWTATVQEKGDGEYTVALTKKNHPNQKYFIDEMNGDQIISVTHNGTTEAFSCTKKK